MKVALIGICRYANEYVEEWINHYLSIGIDHIYLCDNNDVNDDSLEHLLFNATTKIAVILLELVFVPAIITSYFLGTFSTIDTALILAIKSN